MDPGINIIDLNLDVLDIIFSKLNMKDQINLGCAHPNLREGFLLHNRSKLKIIDVGRLITAEWDSLLSLCGFMVESNQINLGCAHPNLREGFLLHNSKLKKIDLGHFEIAQWDSLLSLCGFMVESLVLNIDFLWLPMNCVVTHCTSLQEIFFRTSCEDVLDKVGAWLCELTSLNTIVIGWSGYQGLYSGPVINETIIQSMQKLPNLRKLELQYCNVIALIQIRELTQLEELIIINRQIDITDIGYICATLKNLRVLIFKGNLRDSDYFHDLPQFCPLLEKLTLNSHPRQIPYFPKLKELEINIDSYPIDQRLGECGHRYAKQLDKLTIHTYYPIENSELWEQLRGIKHFEVFENNKKIFFFSSAPEVRPLNVRTHFIQLTLNSQFMLNYK